MGKEIFFEDVNVTSIGGIDVSPALIVFFLPQVRFDHQTGLTRISSGVPVCDPLPEVEQEEYLVGNSHHHSHSVLDQHHRDLAISYPAYQIAS